MNCPSCHKSFTTKNSLLYHISKNVCTKNTNFQCSTCKKCFSTKSNLNRHCARVKSCKDATKTNPSQSLPNPSQSLPNPSQSLPNSNHNRGNKTVNQYECFHCHKKFTRKDNYTRHINKSCKFCLVDDNQDKILKLEKKIHELENKPQTTIINQTNKSQINNYNQTINVKINNFHHITRLCKTL